MMHCYWKVLNVIKDYIVLLFKFQFWNEKEKVRKYYSKLVQSLSCRFMKFFLQNDL